MTPGARVQAAIELLGDVDRHTAPADRTVAAFFRARRYIGGGDRRAVADRVYAALRRRAALDWWIERAGRPPADPARARIVAGLALLDGWPAARIAGAFDGGRHAPPPLDAAETALAATLAGQALDHPAQPERIRLEVPAWLEPALRAAFADRFAAELAALLVEAPLDLRINTLKATRDEAVAALAADSIAAAPTPLSPLALRVHGRPPLAATAAFRDGLVEVQDEGSQLVALLVDARPGMRVCDFCAGAGGKTLALAAAMRNKGHVVACDVLRGRIERSSVRLRRAGVHNVERRGLTSERDPWIKRHAGGFDRVLVDVPCTGIGAWRRNPDARWRFGAHDLAELIETQRRILESACRLVRPGGRLVYATCSLLPAENADQVAWFLDRALQFAVRPIGEVWAAAVGGECPAEGPFLSLTPARHGTDGFFAAVLERRPALAAAKPPSAEPGPPEPAA